MTFFTLATEHPLPYLSYIDESKNNKIMSAFSDQVKGNWKQIKGQLKQEYGELTDNDLVFEEGKEDELVGRLQEKLGKTKAEVKDMIDSIGK